MSEQLGRIERPEAELFRRGKKLYLVPLIYCGEQAPDEYKEKCRHYWQQVAEHLANLESKIGKVRRIYHESVFQSGEEGMRAIERLNPGGYQLAKQQWEDGATLEAVEDQELIEEVMDWQRCVMFGFMSEKVAGKVSGFYVEAAKKRNEAMASRIAVTLGEDEAGLLFIQEGHSLQFPADIEVFSIFPRALDEIHRWLRDQASLEIEKATEAAARKTEQGGEGVAKRPKTRVRKRPKA
jgi:hypothetical protein